MHVILHSFSFLFVCYFVCLFVCLFAFAAEAMTQEDIDNLAKNLDIQYEVLTNLRPLKTYLAQMTFTNKGSSAIKKDNWAIYLCVIYMVEPDHLLHNPKGYVLPGGSGIKFTHISGCLHKLQPTNGFQDLAADDSLTFQYNASWWSVARTDTMPRWYVAADGLEPKTIDSTDGEKLDFVADFVTEKQWKRYPDDQYDPYTPEKRFEADNIADLGKAPLNVIPTPVQVDYKGDSKRLSLKDEGWKVYAQKGLEEEAKFLAGKFNGCY